MAWICAQKAAGKFYGATTGLFLAYTWGHYHDRMFHYLKWRGNRMLFQLGIIMVCFFNLSRLVLWLLITSLQGKDMVLMNYLLINYT